MTKNSIEHSNIYYKEYCLKHYDDLLMIYSFTSRLIGTVQQKKKIKNQDYIEINETNMKEFIMQ